MTRREYAEFMPRRIAREIPPPLELACLSVLWRLNESNVRRVQSELAPTRPLAYTTVMTMLERLARKQLVTRRKSGRHFVYSPAVDRATVRQHAVRYLVESLFDGSEEDLRLYMSIEPATNGASPAIHPHDDTDESMDAVLL
jgi:predicted transcriptional regulator